MVEKDQLNRLLVVKAWVALVMRWDAQLHPLPEASVGNDHSQ